MSRLNRHFKKDGLWVNLFRCYFQGRFFFCLHFKCLLMIHLKFICVKFFPENGNWYLDISIYSKLYMSKQQQQQQQMMLFRQFSPSLSLSRSPSLSHDANRRWLFRIIISWKNIFTLSLFFRKLRWRIVWKQYAQKWFIAPISLTAPLYINMKFIRASI